MEPSQPYPEQPVAEVLNNWPATIAVFLRRRMACVGCVMARFETLHEAAVNYHIPTDELHAEIRAAMKSATPAAIPGKECL
jgi:hybrid cluster-associated redox disulfide protein